MGLDMIMLMVLDLRPQLEIITIPVTQTPVQQLHHIGNGKNLSFILIFLNIAKITFELSKKFTQKYCNFTKKSY